MPNRYALIVAQSGDTTLQVTLNGIPVHRVAMPKETFRSATTAADHYLKPGENVLGMHVVRGVVGPETAVSATLWDGNTDDKLGTIMWPHEYSAFGNTGHGGSPLGGLTKTFALPSDHLRPLYMDSPATRLPLEGTQESWEPIRTLHDSFARGDANGVYDGLDLRSREHHRFHEVDESSPGHLRKLVNERVQSPYSMNPLDPQKTRFEPCADGRMHCVYRTDGAPLIAGKPGDPEVPEYEVHRAFLVFHENRYRILY